MELENMIFDGVNLGFRTTTLLLHVYGIRLLCKHSWKKHLLIINMALTNIVLCLCSYVHAMLHIMEKTTAKQYLLGIVASGFLLAYFASLSLLTVQRFLEVYLHMAYTRSLFEVRKQGICVASWVFALLYILAMSVALQFGVTEHLVFYTIPYVHETVWQCLLLLQFVVVYGYLYAKFRQSRKLRGHSKVSSLRKPRIFAPFIVVFSFIVFDTVPGVLLHFMKEYNINVIRLLYSLDMLCNSLLYIFIRKDIREQVVRDIEDNSPVSL